MYCRTVVAKNSEEDFERALKHVEKGRTQAFLFIASCYLHANGVRRDTDKALEYYTKAANQGSKNAQYNLGKMYQDGEGVKKDALKAKECFQLAGDIGKNRYIKSHGVTKSMQDAFEHNKIEGKFKTKEFSSVEYFDGKSFFNDFSFMSTEITDVKKLRRDREMNGVEPSAPRKSDEEFEALYASMKVAAPGDTEESKSLRYSIAETAKADHYMEKDQDLIGAVDHLYSVYQTNEAVKNILLKAGLWDAINISIDRCPDLLLVVGALVSRKLHSKENLNLLFGDYKKVAKVICQLTYTGGLDTSIPESSPLGMLLYKLKIQPLKPNISCNVCSTNVRTTKCSGCSKEFYCSKDCQKKDWKFHKPLCLKWSGKAGTVEMELESKRLRKEKDDLKKTMMEDEALRGAVLFKEGKEKGEAYSHDCEGLRLLNNISTPWCEEVLKLAGKDLGLVFFHAPNFVLFPKGCDDGISRAVTLQNPSNEACIIISYERLFYLGNGSINGLHYQKIYIAKKKKKGDKVPQWISVARPSSSEDESTYSFLLDWVRSAMEKAVQKAFYYDFDKRWKEFCGGTGP